MGFNPENFLPEDFLPEDFLPESGGSDTTPAPFSFAPQTGVAPSTLIVSGGAVISGINQPASISITGGEYSINGGAWTSSPGSILNGEQVQVRHTSAAGHEAAVNTQLTVGGVAATFTSITMALPFYRGGGGSDDETVRHVLDWWDEHDKRRKRDARKKARPRSAKPARPTLPLGAFPPASIVSLAPSQSESMAIPMSAEAPPAQPAPTAAPYDHAALLRAVLMADAAASLEETTAAATAPAATAAPVDALAPPVEAAAPAAAPVAAPPGPDPAILEMQQSMAASMDAQALSLQTTQQLKQDVTAALDAVTAALTTSQQERQALTQQIASMQAEHARTQERVNDQFLVFTRALEAFEQRAQQSEQAVIALSGQVAQALSQAFVQIGALLAERPKGST